MGAGLAVGGGGGAGFGDFISQCDGVDSPGGTSALFGAGTTEAWAFTESVAVAGGAVGHGTDGGVAGVGDAARWLGTRAGVAGVCGAGSGAHPAGEWVVLLLLECAVAGVSLALVGAGGGDGNAPRAAEFVVGVSAGGASWVKSDFHPFAPLQSGGDALAVPVGGVGADASRVDFCRRAETPVVGAQLGLWAGVGGGGCWCC